MPTPTARPTDRDSFTASPSRTRDAKAARVGGETVKTTRTAPKASARALSPSFMDASSFTSKLSAPKPSARALNPKPMDSFQSFTPRSKEAGPPARTLQRSKEVLGTLSRAYEAKGPGTVSTGKGDLGGVSYGSYQLSSKEGAAKDFVSSLKSRHPDYHSALSRHKPGTAEFTKTWKDLAAKDPKRFDAAQHDYIQSRYYDKQKPAIQKATGIDLNTRSQVLRDVAWSTAVQHLNKTDDIFKAALRGRDPATVSDADLIQGVYAERGRTNADGSLAYFGSSSRDIQRGVASRYERESRDALDRLSGGGR